MEAAGGSVHSALHLPPKPLKVVKEIFPGEIVGTITEILFSSVFNDNGSCRKTGVVNTPGRVI